MSGSRTIGITTAPPSAADGPALHALAAGTGVLDVNTRYAYALWGRDFASTSVVARLDGRPVGFVTGYRRPGEPEVLFVWQVAVDAAARGRGVAGRMLDDLAGRVRPAHLETTITADNAASIALFTAFARRHGATVDRTALFGSAELGADHEPEHLYRIGPIDPGEMHER
jgi:L-2,4-diaminobutyric acid acetyltransferase